MSRTESSLLLSEKSVTNLCIVVKNNGATGKTTSILNRLSGCGIKIENNTLNCIF